MALREEMEEEKATDIWKAANKNIVSMDSCRDVLKTHGQGGIGESNLGRIKKLCGNPDSFMSAPTSNFLLAL